MHRRLVWPILAVLAWPPLLCGCGVVDLDLAGTAHHGREGCDTIRPIRSSPRSIAFSVGYVAQPGLMTVPDIMRWYPCAVRADGRVVALAGGSFPDVDYFSWMPDGGSVVFAVERRGRWQIYRSAVDGRPPVRLTPAGHSQFAPAVSPDGRSIAYTESAARDSVWVMRSDGSDPRRLTPADGSGTPAWSPDGAALTFIRGRELWLLDLRDGHRRLLDPDVAGSPPAWSPDGRLIAYAGAGYDLLVVSPRDGFVHRLGPRDPGTVYDDAWWVPAWSPDGRWIAYDTAEGVSVVTRRGRHERLSASASGPSWSDAGMLTVGYGELDVDNLVLIGPMEETSVWGAAWAPN